MRWSSKEVLWCRETMSKKRKLMVENGKGKRYTETSYERQRETVSKSSLGSRQLSSSHSSP